MKNILLVTNIYPRNNKCIGTQVCHFFTKEWVKLGYSVKVVHVQSKFPLIFYCIGNIYKGYISAKTGSSFNSLEELKCKRFERDGVDVLRYNAFKWWPHGRFTKKSLNKIKASVIKDFELESFVPDVICGHFPNPTLELLCYFGEKYHARTCYVSHGEIDLIKKNYPDDYQQLLSKIDVIGYRSKSIKEIFENEFGIRNRSFICYSGVPEQYITNKNKTYKNTKPHFIFLGSLYALKRVEDTIVALHMVFPDNNFTFDIIGDGHERKNIEKQIQLLDMSESVNLYGKLPRDKAQELLSNADYFIMVSKHEAFGLVYLEAMSKGLICVGTKGQGIDGVINDGENGFLCESCSPAMLAKVIKKIISMPIEKKNQISNAARETAINLTDTKVAQHYIGSIIEK